MQFEMQILQLAGEFDLILLQLYILEKKLCMILASSSDAPFRLRQKITPNKNDLYRNIDLGFDGEFQNQRKHFFLQHSDLVFVDRSFVCLNLVGKRQLRFCYRLIHEIVHTCTLFTVV